MTIKQIHELNEKFRKNAVHLSELIPSSNLVATTSIAIRSTHKTFTQFRKLLVAKNGIEFDHTIDTMEEELDEIIFVLDQLEEANKKQQINQINAFIKEGYDLIAVYSRLLDYVIDQKVQEKE